MNDRASYRSIVRSTGIIGGASLAMLIVGMVRAKLFALMVGPEGIGLLGVFNTLLTTGAAIAGIGINTSAVRQLAGAGERPRSVQRAVWSLALVLAGVGSLVMAVARGPLSIAVSGNAGLAPSIGWLSAGLGLSVLAATQGAVFQGLRRLGDLARVNLGGTVLGAVAGVGLVYLLRIDGLVAAALAGPAAILLVGTWVGRRLPRPAEAWPSRGVLAAHWRAMLLLGSGIVAAAVMTAVGQLALRAIVLRTVGLHGNGLFQAAMAITTLNSTLVLGAMAADYYPRLSEAADSAPRLVRLLDQQLHVALLLSMPILIGLSAGATLWLGLLYTGEFVPAAGLLRWQLVAEVIRLPQWAVAYVLLARRDTGAYIATEACLLLTLVPAAWLLVPRFGIAGIGLAYAFAYAMTFALTLTLVMRRHGVVLEAASVRLGLVLLAVVAALAVLARWSNPLALAVGLPAAVAAGGYTLVQLYRTGALPGPLQPLAARAVERLRR